MTGDKRLSRSYLAVRHLLRQLELKREKGLGSRVIPSWLSGFIDEITDRFEPFRGVARVGYECAYSEGLWELSLFLGETELIGGAHDGQLLPVNFRFDLSDLTDLFEHVESLFWNAFPARPEGIETPHDLSFLTLTGTIAGESVQLQLHSTPPRQVGPAMRQHVDGRLELT